MKHFVARTCTVVRGPDEEDRRQNEPRPLESFRDEEAYVLLGPPGAGKTKALEREAKEEGVEPITARDFQELDPEPELENATLYIDGLDETRAGAADGRTPFDAIRRKLQRLGRPRFRLSCREADWFGANDREHLNAVSPDGEVSVLRLDPMSEEGVLENLDRNLGVDDPKAFVAKARKRGVDGLLGNPQSLKMLVAAVDEEEWPRTKAETFDLACRKLIEEHNQEHRIAASESHDIESLMHQAGHLCALLLLSGRAGFTLPGTDPNRDYPGIEQIPRPDRQLSRQVLRRAVFASPSEGRVAATHRQVAEFLAARYLADLIAHGLPVRRALALMTGFDGGILSELRGLTAWLATHSRSARIEIIERDPLGTVEYGDVGGFDTSEKRHLLQSLKTATDQNPWLVGDSYLDSPKGHLVGPDLEDDLRRTLTDPARDEAHQSFVLLVVQAIRAGAPSPALAEPLMAIVRDHSWPMDIRCAALEAYMRASEGNRRASVTLRRLLDEIYTGTVATQNDDLLGALLTLLYPDELPVPDLIRYLREPARRNLWTRYGVFWTDRLIEKSTIEQMVQLLDLLRVPMEQARSESGASPRGVDLLVRPPVVLLRRLLDRSPQSISREQLFYWLDFAGWLGKELEFSAPSVVSDAEFIGSWLSDRPDVQKAIIEDGVTKCREDGHFFVCMSYVIRSLFDAKKPEDYGEWCADQALGVSNDDIAHWFVWEAAAIVHNPQEPETRHGERITGKLSGNARLAQLFEGRLAALEEQSRFQQGIDGTPQADPIPYDGRFDELRNYVKNNEAALHANQSPPRLLYHLARAYLNDFSDVPGKTPDERLQFLLGSGDDLYDAALAGLRGTIQRTDLPTADTIIQLTAKKQIHLLAYPSMVSLEELYRTAEGHTIQLREAQARLAVAIHFAVWRLPHTEQSAKPPPWLQAILARDPDTVADVWARCLRFRLLNGETVLPDTYELAHKPDFAPMAQAAAIRLLRAFPVRCKNAEQLPILRSLLQAACLYGDTTQFLELIGTKLKSRSMYPRQRVYWLTAGLFVRPESYSDRLESYVSGNNRRIPRLAEMTVDAHAGPPPLRDAWDATVLATLIRLLGPYSVVHPDAGGAYRVTLPMEATWSLYGFIDRLAEDTSAAATTALESLAADERLGNWRSRLLDRLNRQRSVCREATFAPPSLSQVARVLENGRPTSAADLAGLTTDILTIVARGIRDGANSSWRQFWNVDSHGRATHPRPENLCRDTLVGMLESKLNGVGAEAQSEARYADDKRSDIRVASSEGGFNTPVEIKRSCHRQLWSAIQTQLIAKYTRDPGADGYGIYLVFWFGEAEDCRPTPRSGPKPKSAAELEKALLDTLSDHERRKISVCVIDVSKPVA